MPSAASIIPAVMGLTRPKNQLMPTPTRKKRRNWSGQTFWCLYSLCERRPSQKIHVKDSDLLAIAKREMATTLGRVKRVCILSFNFGTREITFLTVFTAFAVLVIFLAIVLDPDFTDTDFLLHLPFRVRESCDERVIKVALFAFAPSKS